VALLPGDGIDQEVAAQAVKLLRALEEALELEPARIGERSIEFCGGVQPRTLDLARRADATLPGITGVPAMDLRRNP